MASEDESRPVLIYGNEPRVPPPWRRNRNEERVDNDDVPEPIIQPMKATEGLKAGLHVKNLDLNITQNTRAHRTSDYECTEEHEVDGKVEAPELVVRRGQSILVGIQFDKPYEKAKFTVQFRLTTGQFAETHTETYGRCALDESREKPNAPGEWYAKLLTNKGDSITAEIHIPADCAIGEWNIGVFTTEKAETGKDVKRLYKHSDPFYMLFNPWCKDDDVYMEDEPLLKEYILNPHGALYRGSKYNGVEWNYGQFEAGMLDGSFNIIRKCFKPSNMYQLADPIKISRVIAQIVNSQDDNGVLTGNWTGDYDGGVGPGTWTGSVNILKQYMKTGSPVKYGQCWVFSGVTTTVCRAIGLPARSVTNFDSAHDTDESNTIDVYYHVEDGLAVRNEGNSDSIWNFHVWNEVWMERPDLYDKKCNYNGWQVIDATPQECSGGYYTCGPCSVEAVKHGLVGRPYDGSFVFSEVNADRVHWHPSEEGGYERHRLDIDCVGRNISTKFPDGLPFNPTSWWEREKLRLDITDNYKFPEDSVENREAVMRAACNACRPLKANRAYVDDTKFEDVKFKLHVDPTQLNYGQDIDVTLIATTESDYPREITKVSFRFRSMKYFGRLGKAFKMDNRQVMVTPRKDEAQEFKSTVKFEDYSEHLDEDRNMCVQVYALVKATFGRPVQNCVEFLEVTFTVPNLEVTLPPTANKGEEIEAVVKFSNPLGATTLTECTMKYESGGFDNKDDIKQPNVPPYGTYKGKFKMVPKRCGNFTLNFLFSSPLLQNLTGSASIHVKKKEEVEDGKMEEKEKEKDEKEKEKEEEMEVA